MTEPSAGMSWSEPEASYRPMSLLAVIGFALALLSPIAFASRWLWFYPPIVLGVTAFGSWKLERARGEYSGQFLAILSIVIALCSTIGAPTQYFTERIMILGQGRQFANEYLDFLLSNEAKKAFEMTLHPYSRSGVLDEEIVLFAKNYRDFLSGHQYGILGGKGEQATVTHLPVTAYGYAEGFYHARFEYRIDLKDEEYLVSVMARGGTSEQGDWKDRQWYIDLQQTNIALVR